MGGGGGGGRNRTICIKEGGQNSPDCLFHWPLVKVVRMEGQWVGEGGGCPLTNKRSNMLLRFFFLLECSLCMGMCKRVSLWRKCNGEHAKKTLSFLLSLMMIGTGLIGAFAAVSQVSSKRC